MVLKSLSPMWLKVEDGTFPTIINGLVMLLKKQLWNTLERNLWALEKVDQFLWLASWTKSGLRLNSLSQVFSALLPMLMDPTNFYTLSTAERSQKQSPIFWQNHLMLNQLLDLYEPDVENKAINTKTKSVFLHNMEECFLSHLHFTKCFKFLLTLFVSF